MLLYLLTLKSISEKREKNSSLNSFMKPLSYRNQSIDLDSQSMDWFLHDRDIHHERVNV